MTKKAAGSAVTLLDIAKHLDLSRATVSLVLRDSPLVAQATRERVLKAMQELGYVYNRSAAGMRSRRTHTVGVLINDIMNPYFAVLVRSIESKLSASGYVTLLGNSDEVLDRQMRFIDTVREHNVDGIILCAAETTRASDLRPLVESKLPFVMVSRNVADVPADFVGVDNRKGMQLATAHLLSLGHRRIAMMGGHSRTSMAVARVQGYKDALQAAGIGLDERLIFPLPSALNTRQEGKRMIGNALSLDDPPTAAVCNNDMIAFGVMMGLKAHGREVGVDFSVVGFDDVPEAALWEPALTTVQVRQHSIGDWAAELLLARIADPERPIAYLSAEPSLVVRGTCGALNPRLVQTAG